MRIKPLKDHIVGLVNDSIRTSRKKSGKWNETLTGLSVAIFSQPKDMPINRGDVMAGIRTIRGSVRSEYTVLNQLKMLADYRLLIRRNSTGPQEYYLNFEIPGELLDR